MFFLGVAVGLAFAFLGSCLVRSQKRIVAQHNMRKIVH